MEARQVRIVLELGFVIADDIVLDRIYYEDEALSDISERPTKFFVFTHHFVLRVTPKGTPFIDVKRDGIEIVGTTNEKMIAKLERYVDDVCYGQVPSGSARAWIPDDFLEIKRAIKSGALKV